MLGREAAERATKSREVDLSRLKGFHLRFAPKMRCGVTGNWSNDQMTYFGSWMAEIGSIPTKTTVCVCVSPATKEQIKFVYFVPKWLRAKILNENWRCRVAKKRPKPVWILNIDHRKGDIYPAVARQRFTFDKHFVPKLSRQKRNHSSEDSWIKGKLRSIEGPLRPRQAGQVP